MSDIGKPIRELEIADEPVIPPAREREQEERQEERKEQPVQIPTEVPANV